MLVQCLVGWHCHLTQTGVALKEDLEAHIWDSSLLPVWNLHACVGFLRAAPVSSHTSNNCTSKLPKTLLYWK